MPKAYILTTVSSYGLGWNQHGRQSQHWRHKEIKLLVEVPSPITRPPPPRHPFPPLCWLPVVTIMAKSGGFNLGFGVGPPLGALRNEQAATLLEFMYHSRIVLSVGGSVWYMIRNIRCTVTIHSVLANSKTQNAFLFTVNAIFLHEYPLTVEPGSTPRPLVQKKLGEILYLLICSFLPCLSWLLRSRVRKSRRELWITLYTGTSMRIVILLDLTLRWNGIIKVKWTEKINND